MARDEIADLELVVQELQKRIGELVSSYEMQLAAIKLEAFRAIEQKDEELSNKDQKIADLHAQFAPKPPKQSVKS